MKRLILALSLWLIASSVSASPVTWTLDGTITDSWMEEYAVGQLFAVELYGDAEAVDLCDSPASGLYETPGAVVRIGEAVYTATATYWEVNNQAGSCLVESPGVVTRSFFTDAPFWLLTLAWGQTSTETFPTSIEAGYAWMAEYGWWPSVYAVTVPDVPLSEAPEPMTGALVVVGLGLVRLVKRTAGATSEEVTP